MNQFLLKFFKSETKPELNLMFIYFILFIYRLGKKIVILELKQAGVL